MAYWKCKLSINLFAAFLYEQVDLRDLRDIAKQIYLKWSKRERKN